MIFVLKNLLIIKYKKENDFTSIKITKIIILICLIIKVKITFNFNQKNIENITIYKLEDILNLNYIKKNHTILIFEPHIYHFECSPGYAKYFIDLGFNVDILMHFSGMDAFCLFENKKKIRLFLYKNIRQINSLSKTISLFMRYYSFILIQTISSKSIKIVSKLGLLNIKKSIYVFHCKCNELYILL